MSHNSPFCLVPSPNVLRTYEVPNEATDLGGAEGEAVCPLLVALSIAKVTLY